MNKNTIYKLYFVLEFYLGTLYFIGLFFFFREKNFLAIVASFVFDAKKTRKFISKTTRLDNCKIYHDSTRYKYNTFGTKTSISCLTTGIGVPVGS